MEPVATLAILATELQLPMTLDELLARALGRVGQLVGTTRASLRIFDGSRRRLFLGARLGEPIHDIPWEQQPGEGLLGWVAGQLRPLRTGDAEADPRYLTRPGMRDHLRSFVGVPVIYQGQPVGVLVAVHAERDRFDEQHELLMRIVASMCAPHLEVARLARLARVDPLTGALNVAHLDAALAAAASGEHSAVLLVDLDGFRSVNERFGREVGDQMLRAVARVLAGSLRVGDAVVRYGDDSFLLVIAGTSLASASRVAERARATLAGTPLRVGELSFDITVSIGVAERHASEARDGVIRRAESALGMAREAGGNMVRLGM